MNCKECNRPMTPSQRKQARRSEAAHRIWQEVVERTKNSPEHKALKEWIRVATHIKQEDLERRID